MKGKILGVAAIVVLSVAFGGVYTQNNIIMVANATTSEANFTWEPSNPTDLQVVHFIDLSKGNIIAWIWYFGDGNTSTQQNPSHKYADNGTYNVRLVIILNDGSILYKTKQILVSNVPPHAVIECQPIYNSSNVSLASASYDDDGIISSCHWEFGDGAAATGCNVTHRYLNDGVYVVNLTVYDNDGASNATNATIMVDTHAPQTTYNISCQGWCNENVTVTLNASDNLSGVNYTKYKIDDGDWMIYNGSITISTEGIHKIYFYSIDNAGNEEKVKNIVVKIDKTVPYTVAKLNGSTGNNGWYRSDVTITLNASDNLSGVNYTKYKIDDGDWMIYNGSITISTEGIHKIYFYSIDNVGNVEGMHNITIKIDKTKPSCSLLVPQQGYIYIANRQIMPTLFHHTIIIGKLTAIANATDKTSGVYYVEFILNNEPLWKDYVSPYTVELPQELPASFSNKLYVIAYDEAGNYNETPVITYVKIA